MDNAHDFLKNLALVLCVAAVATVVFQKLRLPVVFGYLLAGLIIGPHIPVPLVADEATVRTLAELGVILLMFSLGLELSLRKLLEVGSKAGVVAIAQSSAMILTGFALGQLFGWTTLESIYAGAVVAIASTTIIVKAFAEQGVRGPTADLVFGILIFEDLIAIFLLVVLTAISSSGGISPSTLAMTALRLAAFLAGLIGVGLLVVPRLMRTVVRLDRPETTLVASIGICFASALVALSFGYSTALGAFLAGSLIAESGTEHAVQKLVHPVRDLFAAIFFVSVGMLIDPASVADQWVAVLVFSFIVIAGNLIVVAVSAFLTGVDTRTSVQAGMSLGQIGEFSFIIAGLGVATNATGDFFYPMVVAISATTTLTTPLMIRSAAPVAAFVDRNLPRPLQTFVALYGSWIERLGAAPREPSRRNKTRRRVGLLLIDVAVLAAVVVATSLELGPLSSLVSRVFGISASNARLVGIGFGMVVATPLLFGLVRTARLLGFDLAVRALPAAAAGRLDFAAAPRRALVTALQLGIVLLAGIPLVAVTQPFLPPLRGLAVLTAVVGLLGFAFWRSATNLQGHARAGAEIIAATLAKQMAKRDEEMDVMTTTQQLDAVLPGLGRPVPLRIAPDSPMIGKTLAKLELRAVTGATILAIKRDGEQSLVPSGSETLRAGDLLALAGTRDAIARAKALLSPAAEGDAGGH